MGREMMNEILADLHERVKAYRNTETIVTSNDFQKMFEVCNCQHQITLWILHGKDKSLKDWISNNRKLLPLEDWSVEMLRHEVANLKIPNSRQMPKGMLINKLRRI